MDFSSKVCNLFILVMWQKIVIILELRRIFGFIVFRISDLVSFQASFAAFQVDPIIALDAIIKDKICH